MPDDVALRKQGPSKRYRSEPSPVLDQVDLAVRAASSVDLVR